MFPQPKKEKSYLERAFEPQNRILNRHTQPNPMSIISTLGYNTGVSVLARDVSICRLSGSSINRRYAKDKRDERKRVPIEQIQPMGRIGQSVRDFGEYREELQRLYGEIQDRERIRKSISRPSVKRELRIHLFSKRSKGKVRDRATAFYRALGVNGCFATFTFIEQLSEKSAQIILNKFLTVMSQREGRRVPYLWVKEKQEQNNDRIHFHMVFSKRIDITAYNALWVKQQYNSGLRFKGLSKLEMEKRYRKTMENVENGLIGKKYKEGTIQELLNPLDVQKIKSIYGLSWYMTKYITKNKSKEFDSIPWHCSRNVSRLFTKTLISRSCLRELNSEKNFRIDRKGNLIAPQPPTIGKYWNLFYVGNRKHFVRYLVELEEVNRWILEDFWPEIYEHDEQTLIRMYCN